MEEAILGLPDQFRFKPEMIDKKKLFTEYESVVVVGMGGSHLCGGILKAVDPSLPITIHNGYGLPDISPAQKKKILFVFVSYSGNTEETLDALEEAMDEGANVAVITTGGKMKALADRSALPMIVVPDEGIQPRNAVGHSVMALAALLGSDRSLSELRGLADKLDPKRERAKGLEVAENLSGLIPLIYASSDNLTLAYNWKIKFNETTKIPSFYNVFPELNHNEMEGFGAVEGTRRLSSEIAVYILSDEEDHPRIQKRMDITEQIYKERGIKTFRFKLEGSSRAEKIFKGLLVADWASLELSVSRYKTDPDTVPFIEKFKKLMK